MRVFSGFFFFGSCENTSVQRSDVNPVETALCALDSSQCYKQTQLVYIYTELTKYLFLDNTKNEMKICIIRGLNFRNLRFHNIYIYK